MSDYLDAASHLIALQNKANPGMGVSCVRAIVDYLKRGDYDSARRVADLEFDKLYQYKFTCPELPEYVNKFFNLGKEGF